jgi:hypothetical protein
LDDKNNPVLNPANINIGANNLAEGDTAESLASREKIRLSVEEWNTIKEAVEHGVPIPTDASKNMLLGYHYALRRQSKQLARERSEIQKRKDSAIAASIALHKARSDTSYTNSKRHHRHGSKVENLKHSKRQSLSKNLDSSFLSIEEQGNIIPKTLEAALVAAQTYLYTTRPSRGDPREHMHRATLQGLRMVGNKLKTKDKEAYRNKERINLGHHAITTVLGTGVVADDLGHHRQDTTKAQSMEEPEGPVLPPRHTTTKTMEKMGVCTTPVPKGFKLPHDHQKYDGS